MENGSAKIFVNPQQAEEISIALKQAIEMIEDKQVKFNVDEIKHIKTMTVKENNFHIKNAGTIIIQVYNKEKIEICVSLLKGADPVLWLDIISTKKVVSVLDKTINSMR
ncbi:hypothetical protein [Clostridium sp. 'White wine YQ']|uniref:hypothetical protein n=1 Tax=Clostridium sp. 'White wine YQ' TaxID=3027474 RepID=UPI0023653211|nr:hypothetical protein [Clostridium sp. 'White wine YQ']MDD7793061.1 hypothetical protein [Clostridium sp. 'White wine YQ']